MLKAVLFDLDGTLLPMNEEDFIKQYLGLIFKYVAHLGYQKDLIDNILVGTKKCIKMMGLEPMKRFFGNTLRKFTERNV